MLLVPLLASGQTQAIIVLNDMQRGRAFSPDDVRLLETLAASMSVALQSARLFHETQRLLKETERRGREATALADVGRDLSSTLDLATVMDRIATHAKDLLAASDSAIFLPAAGRTILPRDRRARRIGGRDQGHVDRRGRRHHRQAAAERTAGTHQRHAGRPARRADSGHRAAARRADDGGAARLRRPGAGRDGGMAHGRSPFEPHELEFLVGLSLQAAVALQNARLFNETSKRSSGRRRRPRFCR